MKEKKRTWRRNSARNRSQGILKMAEREEDTHPHLKRVWEGKLAGQRSHWVCPRKRTWGPIFTVQGGPRIWTIHAFVTAAFLIIFGIFLRLAQSLLSRKQSLSGLLSPSAASRPRSLKPPSCLSYLSAHASFICLYFFKSFPAATLGTGVVPWFSENETFQHADVGKRWNGQNNVFFKISPAIYQEKNISSQLSYNLCSVNQPVHFWKDARRPRVLHKEKQERTTGTLIVPNRIFLPLRNADSLWLQAHQVYVTPSQLDKMLTGIPTVYRNVNATSWREISFHIGNYFVSLANSQHL